jgi:G6PDH family F420-dependent oxidoreductase
LEVQGHSPYAWSVLGAAAQATEQIPLMTYVTCPIGRYHPAVVAQKAATMQLLSDGRFTLGLGAGENLNEHIVGGRWPLPACATRCWRRRWRSSGPCGRAGR